MLILAGWIYAFISNPETLRRISQWPKKELRSTVLFLLRLFLSLIANRNRLSANLIENNLSLFDAHFQDLYIDKYQFLQIMLIMFQ